MFKILNTEKFVGLKNLRSFKKVRFETQKLLGVKSFQICVKTFKFASNKLMEIVGSDNFDLDLSSFKKIINDNSIFIVILSRNLNLISS